MPNGAKNWCFTLNHYDDDEQQSFRDLAALPWCKFVVFGREVAPTTLTPHLQGYIRFSDRKSLQFLKREINDRAHWIVARGSAQQNITYCEKEGDAERHGELPTVARGNTSAVQEAQRFIDEYISDNGRAPSEREVAQAHPSAYIFHHRGLLRYARVVAPVPQLREGPIVLRGWQQELEDRLENPADDRTVEFFVDVDGAAGKTFFVQNYLTKHTDAQMLSVGKRDDIAHIIDASKRVFFMCVPRGSMEFLQYSVLESLKDRMIMSPKYDSCVKILEHWLHVIVFTNEPPDETKLTNDRFKIVTL